MRIRGPFYRGSLLLPPNEPLQVEGGKQKGWFILPGS